MLTGFTVINRIGQGIIMDENMNKTVFVFSNKSLDSVLIKTQDYVKINRTTLLKYNESDLRIIPISD